jgi:nicotinamide-nucleotide amidase
MRVEIVAIGTELLLGQIVDTNSARIATQLAAAGIDSHFQTRVGDNEGRIVAALRAALSRSEAVVACGGLGPTQDDITREAIAALLGVELRRDPQLLAAITALFASRGRKMAESNTRQADVPVGATPIEQRRGTAPGLICPVGEQVIYALPGVPHELDEMLERAVLPDLVRRATERGERGVIASRTLRTWGISESHLAELVAPRLEALSGGGTETPTIAFLASGIEGIKLRLTVKSAAPATAEAALDAEVAELRVLLGEAIFGEDETTMEAALGQLLIDRAQTMGCAESFTGGLMAARIVAVPGASAWFKGGVVAYAPDVKQRLLNVDPGPVVSADAAVAMAEGVRELLRTDVAIATTGVAGPEPVEGRRVGTAYVGYALRGRPAQAVELSLVGDRERIRQSGTISAFDALRRALLRERA